MHDVFSLGNPEELRRLLTDSGFQHVAIEPASVTVRFPNPDEFLAWESGVDPATAPALQHLDDSAQQVVLEALRQDMQASLREVMQGDRVVISFYAHIAHARRYFLLYAIHTILLAKSSDDIVRH